MINSKAVTRFEFRTVFGLALRIVRFEIAANWRRFESLRTANHDSIEKCGNGRSGFGGPEGTQKRGRDIPLVAPYCAILRVGFWVSQHGQLGAIPPPPFLSDSPFESMRSGGAIPPPLKRSISAILAPIPYENKANWCDTPLCDTISKGYCAIWGGISHWAAKDIPVRKEQEP